MKMPLRVWVVGVLVLSTTLSAPAATYRYAGNNPMAKAMLDMMEIMGFIYRVPDSPYAGGMAYGSGSDVWNPASLYSGMTNPFLFPGFGGMGSLPYLYGMNGFPGANSLSAYPAWSNWNNRAFPGPFNVPGPWSLVEKPAQGERQYTADDKIELSSKELQNLLQAGKVPAEQTVPYRSEQPPSLPPSSRGAGIPTTPSGPNWSGRSLEGEWIGAQKDKLRITGQQFVWEDPSGRVTSGSFRLEGPLMIVQTKESKLPARYRVERSEDGFVAINEAGYRYEFHRPAAVATDFEGNTGMP